MFVMLKPSWEGNFHRALRDDSGKEVGMLEFSPGVEVDLTEKELVAVEGDIGKSLFLVKLDEKNRPRIDFAGTDRFINGEPIPDPEEENEINDNPAIEEIGLSEQAVKVLTAAGITTLDGLITYRAEHDPTELEGIGESTREKIDAVLSRYAEESSPPKE